MRFLALLALLLLVAGVASAGKRCAALCQSEIAACRAAVPASSSCPTGHGHQRCVRQLHKQRARCKPDTLRQCHQNPDPGTCTSATTTTVPGGATTTTVPGAACDVTRFHCSGTLGGAVSGPFDCTYAFANFDAATGQTRFLLNVPTRPGAVDVIAMSLDFSQMPAATTYRFPAAPGAGTFLDTSYTVVGLPSGRVLPINYVAGKAPTDFVAACGWCPAGSMTMVLSSAVARPSGTPGDWCLHGTLDATTVSGTGGTITVHVGF